MIEALQRTHRGSTYGDDTPEAPSELLDGLTTEANQLCVHLMLPDLFGLHRTEGPCPYV